MVNKDFRQLFLSPLFLSPLSVTIICHQYRSMVFLPSDWLVTFKPQRTQCTVGDGSFALNKNCKKVLWNIPNIYSIWCSVCRPPGGSLYKSGALNWIEIRIRIEILHFQADYYLNDLISSRVDLCTFLILGIHGPFDTSWLVRNY